MKTKFYETLLISLVIISIGILALGSVSELTFWTKYFFMDYSVLADALLLVIFFIFFSALFLRVILWINPLSEGVFSTLSKEAFRWKLAICVAESGCSIFLPAVLIFLRANFFRLFGAKIGKGVSIAGELIDPYLIEIGEYAIIGKNSIVLGHAITYDRLEIGRVKIGKRATVGVGSIVMPGVEIGDDSVIAPNAIVAPNTKVPPKELWGGVPARKIKSIYSPKN